MVGISCDYTLLDLQGKHLTINHLSVAVREAQPGKTFKSDVSLLRFPVSEMLARTENRVGWRALVARSWRLAELKPKTRYVYVRRVEGFYI